MNPTKEDIKLLEEWLGDRLDTLLTQGDKVAALLEGNGGQPTPQATQAIIQAAVEVVTKGKVTQSSLPPEKVAQWKTLVGVLAEHATLATKASPPEEKDRTLNKQEAAEFLKIGVRKLEQHMARKDIVYAKLGAGKSATVRFNESDLVVFKLKHTVAARKRA